MYPLTFPEMDSKSHLVSDGCVAICFQMLAYCVYAPLLNQIDALMHTLICLE